MKREFFVLGIIIILFSGCVEINNRRKVKRIIVEGLNIGNRAPELVYPNPEYKTIALSSLRGKMVLIDFWASWCPPCRLENPNIVTVYSQFKDRKFLNGNGFTIYSVSLDTQKSSWVKAIQADNLIWENHVSDLKGWEAEGTYIYKINVIPSNFLIDSEGIIVAKDLKGQQLAAALKGLLAN